MGALSRPEVPPGPLRLLFDALHELHHRAGWPSLRDLAREVGASRTTVSAAFSEPRVPRWGLIELLVETLGGDTERFHGLWLAASGGTPPATPAMALPPDGPVAAPAYAVVPRHLPPDVLAFSGRAWALAEIDRVLVANADQGGGGGTRIALLSGTPVSARPPWPCAGRTGPRRPSRTDSCMPTYADATPTSRCRHRR